MQSKNALSNLRNRYISVLKKCNLLNVFGSLAIAALCVSAMSLNPHITHAATNPSGNTITSGGMAASASDHNLINNGTITGGHIFSGGLGVGDSIAAMYGKHTSGNIDYNFTNNGTINISYIGPLTSADYANANAYGMFASGAGNHNLTNSGDIIISAQGGNANTTNIIANANAWAYGMYAFGTGNHSLTNSGDITVTAQGGTANAQNNTSNANAYAYGMSVDGTGNHVTNSGSISVTAIGGNATSQSAANANAYAYGMYASGAGSYLTNSGNITFIAQGRIANSQTSTAVANALARGMYAASGGSLTNSGNISVTAIGGNATAGTYLYFDNVAVAHAFAYGMYVTGTTGGENLINNYGIINATATKGTASGGGSLGGSFATAHAFEVYGKNSYSVENFATTLKPWTIITGASGTADTVFGIDSQNPNQVINFKNTSLIVRPQITAQGVELGKVYEVKDMIAVANSSTRGNGEVSLPTSANVTGNIAQAVTEVPFLTATLTNGHDPLSATLRIDENINAHTTSGAASAMQMHNTVQLQMGNITKEILQTQYNEMYGELFASNGTNGIAAGSDIEQSKWTVFASPYGSFTNNNDYNFDGSNVGVTGGATYSFNNSFALGAHFNFNISDYNADVFDMDTDSTSIAFGLHALYNIMPQWYVTAQATASISQVESEFSLTTNVAKANDSYDSQALYFALGSGYVFEIAEGHSLTPHIGLSYLNMNMDSYDISWGSGYSMYDMQYDSVSYSAFYADIALNWRSEWQLQNDSNLAFLAGAGVRQNLSGSDIDSDFRVLGSDYSTRASQDDTTFLADAGVEWTVGNFSLSAEYSGEYGASQQSHMGSVNFKFRF